MLGIDIESLISGATVFEMAGMGAILGVAGRFLFSILQGEIPGDGVLAAIIVGGMLGAMVHIFKSGILG